MRVLRHAVILLFSIWGSPDVFAAEIYSVGPIALSPTYNVAGCALVTSNGYAGTDRRLFIPGADGYQHQGLHASASSFWLITVEAFDPTQRLVDQALAVSPSYGNGSYPAQGSRALVADITLGRHLAEAMAGWGVASLMAQRRQLICVSLVKTPVYPALLLASLHHQLMAAPASFYTRLRQWQRHH